MLAFRFVRQHLDPASRLGEILFGLIMVLTVTLTASVIMIQEGTKGARQLLIAAIGCNIAWGIIDAVMYLMNCLTENTTRTRFLRAIKSAPDPQSATRLVRHKIEEEFGDVIPPQDLSSLVDSITKNRQALPENQRLLGKKDVYGAIACFWLVFVSCLPAALPFFVIRQPYLALRLSNCLLLTLLFLVGKKWGEHVGVSPILSGLGMLASGVLLVGIAVLLRG